MQLSNCKNQKHTVVINHKMSYPFYVFYIKIHPLRFGKLYNIVRWQ